MLSFAIIYVIFNSNGITGVLNAESNAPENKQTSTGTPTTSDTRTSEIPTGVTVIPATVATAVITTTVKTDLPGESPGVVSESETKSTFGQTTITTTVSSGTTTEAVTSPAPVTTTTTAATKTTTTTATTTTTTTTTTTANTTTATETTASTVVQTGSYKPLNYDEIRGMWISFLEYDNMLLEKSKEEFTNNISQALDNAAGLGVNTVFVHAVSHHDSYYKSDYFPWSAHITGTVGENPGFDPLDIIINEAHDRNISVQAWVNPLRALTAGEMEEIGAKYTIKKWYNDANRNGTYVVKVDGRWYLNPAYDDVIKLITNGVSEIINKYDVDGIHIDDYFYPTTDASFDSDAFAASGEQSISQFRMKCTDKLVSSIYKAVKALDSKLLFGVSPQGNIDNNYNHMYANVAKWCGNEGYLDYVAPQIYFGFDNAIQPFEKCLSEWEEMITVNSIKLIPGLAVYKIGIEDTWAGNGKYEWANNTDVIKRQYEYAKTKSKYGGFILYRYDSAFNPSSSVKEHVKKEIDTLKKSLGDS